MQLGVKIKEFGIKKFGSLKAFAEAMGMVSSNLHQYLGDKPLRDPGAIFLNKLHRLGCSLDWLFTEEISTVSDNHAEYKAANPLKEENKRLKEENEKLKIALRNISKNIPEV